MSKCIHCNNEINNDSPICMYCGKKIPVNEISEKAKQRFEKERKNPSVATSASNAKGIGSFLLIIGIILDIVSMFMISSGDFSGLGFMSIVGTILFLVGICLISNG